MFKLRYWFVVVVKIVDGTKSTILAGTK